MQRAEGPRSSALPISAGPDQRPTAVAGLVTSCQKGKEQNMSTYYFVPSRNVFGEGSVEETGHLIKSIGGTKAMIVTDAFDFRAIFGGMLGSCLVMGIKRGLFSNEAGMGSAPNAAASSEVSHPVKQGLVQVLSVFIDTIIICSMTGLALVLTGVWQGDAAGAAMTSAAFASTYGFFGSQLLTIALVLFAFTTILGWNYYGERACIYLFGNKGVLPYRLIFIALIASGAFLKLEAIWILADIVNGLMAIPNLIALIALSGVIVAETNKYMNRHKKAAQPSSDK